MGERGLNGTPGEMGEKGEKGDRGIKGPRGTHFIVYACTGRCQRCSQTTADARSQHAWAHYII